MAILHDQPGHCNHHHDHQPRDGEPGEDWGAQEPPTRPLQGQCQPSHTWTLFKVKLINDDDNDGDNYDDDDNDKYDNASLTHLWSSTYFFLKSHNIHSKSEKISGFALQLKKICGKTALILTPKLSAKKCVNYQNHMNVVSEGKI